ncbi:hypothetical protein EC912_11071 [Luteibacter rhizovicinus]|uniref:Uncharacterized protein n=1 Tax=Luteibacter rhizovicinus TaxID=242606 RepID=A0A4R3YHT8_9GAMM|nr:hypothetical protein [Luteibacter rhizovicinus]TCV91641.1 hypothetical protein EC912_11071 [Luteibacter rhizovicinus]
MKLFLFVWVMLAFLWAGLAYVFVRRTATILGDKEPRDFFGFNDSSYFMKFLLGLRPIPSDGYLGALIALLRVGYVLNICALCIFMYLGLTFTFQMHGCDECIVAPADQPVMFWLVYPTVLMALAYSHLAYAFVETMDFICDDFDDQQVCGLAGTLYTLRFIVGNRALPEGGPSAMLLGLRIVLGLTVAGVIAAIWYVALPVPL